MIFRFASPWFLLLLVPAAAAIVYLARRRKEGDARLILPGAGRRLQIGKSVWVRMEASLPWLRGLVLLLLVLAFARPQSGTRQETVSSFGVDIVVAVDTSYSMLAEDFQPRNRLQVAKETIRAFIEGRPTDRIGLVSFASLASTRCPLTLDHAMLQDLLSKVEVAPPDQQATAIGMGLATAVNRMRSSDARSKVAVLLTDGRNNTGEIGPEAAAEAARALDIRVYTIGVGTEGKVLIPMQTYFGIERVYRHIPLDEEPLRRIAEITGGRYFRVTDAEGLQQTFDTINEMEKTEIESRVRILYAELFPWLLSPAGILILLELLAANTRLRRIP